MGREAYFISDAHLGAEAEEAERLKERRLLSFFDFVENEQASLYILGDLFDFYFDHWRWVPEEYRRVVSRLRGLVRSGLRVHYLVGNHDYWLGDFWRNEIGVVLHQRPFEAKIQGRKLFLAHGDGLGGFNLGYQLLKRVLRNPVNIRLYSLLGPSVGFSLARHISRASRKGPSDLSPLLGFAREKFGEGFDGVICGHIHKPTLVRDGGRDFLLLGDWIENFSYGKLKNGVLSLEYFVEES